MLFGLFLLVEVSSLIVDHQTDGVACLFFEGSCEFSNSMCGGIMPMLNATSPCATYLYEANEAWVSCGQDGLTDSFVHCFKSKMPTTVCEDVCPGIQVNGTLKEDKECASRCHWTKLCNDDCRFSSGMADYQHCFGGCLSNSYFSLVDTCAGRCGGHSSNGNCYCDDNCVYDNDCCGDYTAACQNNDVLPAPTEQPLGFLRKMNRTRRT